MFFRIFLLSFFVCMQLCQAEKYKYELSVCAIFRDDAPYLREWIEFHRMLGAEHFYLRSHNSADHYKKVLAPYIKEGLVELSEIFTQDRDESMGLFITKYQLPFYMECIKKARGVSRWVAFLDSDEFLFPTRGGSLKSVLKKFRNRAGVGVNWQMYGTSYVAKIPKDKLMIELLIRRAPVDYSANIHIKSIVQPKYVNNFTDPHSAVYAKGHTQVNTDYKPFTGPFSPYIVVDTLRINHYWVRDEHYLHNYKLPRRIKWGSSPDSFLKTCEELNPEEDTSILQYVPKLRKRMKLK